MAGSIQYDEMIMADGSVRPAYGALKAWLDSAAQNGHFRHKRIEADLLFRRIGITFAVSGEGGDTERLIPFDIIPRVLTGGEWQILADGLVQRVKALNAFLHDIYHDQEILRAGRIPEALVVNNTLFRPEMRGLDVIGGVYVHIAGVDIVRVSDDAFYVLEDNLRTPSGVSYMLENRDIMMRLFPDLFSEHSVAPVAHYPEELLQVLRSVAPRIDDDATVVLLTPGSFNSAYFEHAFLAEQMGIELVEGQDLFVADNRVWMRTPQGPRRVDVIYRRIDDNYLDPLAFEGGSVIGVPGLLSVYRSGHVSLVNAIGTGVADDKATYAFVPEMIRFYLGEKPILKNVPTYRCGVAEERRYVLEHLPELVVKEVHGSGGYGMLVGPKATRAEIEAYKARLEADPAGFIAQPTLALSTCPTFVEEGVAPRHVDLRPFVLTGDTVRVVPGGLTRVALRAGSLVVNSSQGGGTKDTWVLQR